MSDFRRTHHDNWQEHKQKFTEDQLLVLTDLLVSPRYYAWRTNNTTLWTVSGLLTSSMTVATLILFVKDIFTRFCLLWTFIINVEWSSYSHFWHTGSDVRGVSASRGCDDTDCSCNLDKWRYVGAQYYSLSTTTAWHFGAPPVTHSRPLYRDGPSNVVPGTEE